MKPSVFALVAALILPALPAAARAVEKEHPGERRVRELNCAACHPIGPAPPARPAPQVGPPLHRAGLRLQPDWLKGFLARPAKLRPAEPARMPDFRLAAWEIEALAAHLQGLQEPWEEGAPPSGASFGALYRGLPPGDAKRGRAAFERNECAKCHPDPEGKLPPPGERKAWGPDLREMSRKLTREGLAAVLFDPAQARPGSAMPSFFYDQGEPLDPDAPRQIADLAAYLASLAGPPPRVLDLTSGGASPGTRERGRRLALQLNCAGCHAGTGLDPRRPAQVAPPLGYRNAPRTYTREMVAGWLQRPATIPMHERMMGFGRMPTFGLSREEACRIADWLFTLDRAGGGMGGGMMMMSQGGGAKC